MRTVWRFHSAGELIFGWGAVLETAEAARKLCLQRVFLLADPTLEKIGLVEKVAVPLRQSGIVVEVFPGGEPEPSLPAVLKAIEAATIFRPDGVIGLGGGSNMDMAKMVAKVLAHGGSPMDYVGDGKVPGPILPLICVPTTAGTGSEVSGADVFTDPSSNLKLGCLSNFLRPRVAIVDPQMSSTCPKKVTADSGIDALTHAIEAYTAVDNEVFPLPAGQSSVYQGRHFFGDMVAEKAIRLCGQYLKRAVLDGSDLEAREGMALAATLGGLAFSNVGVAAVHALEYPVGGAVHCSHGEGNGLLLPYVMRFNLPVRKKAMADIASWLGEDVAGLEVEQAALVGITAVEKLKEAIGIPGKLRDLGVKQEQLRPFAEKAFGIQRILRVNPRPVTVEDLEGILRAAW
ncbi:MAG: iron-containing alcohol dehydrogenase [Gemmataceae bacterium]|nr:iron-containing alcohol dehydrogenase [Gemmataceae bacterium]